MSDLRIRKSGHGNLGEAGRAGLSEEERAMVLGDVREKLLARPDNRYEDPEALDAAIETVVAQCERQLAAGEAPFSVEELIELVTAGSALVWLDHEYKKRVKYRQRQRLSIYAPVRADDPPDFVDLCEYVERYVQRARQAIFGSPRPPFASTFEAEEWLQLELGRPPLEPGRGYISPLGALSGDAELQSRTLQNLKVAQDILAEVFDLPQESTLEYILTGQIPSWSWTASEEQTGEAFRPFRLWHVDVAEPLLIEDTRTADGPQFVQHGCRIRITFFSRQIRERDLRRIIGQLRTSGVLPRGIAGDENLEAEFYEFVRSRRKDECWSGEVKRPLTWQTILRQWNRSHPRQQYKSVRGLRDAYFRARQRRGLPRRPPKRQGRDEA